MYSFSIQIFAMYQKKRNVFFGESLKYWVWNFSKFVHLNKMNFCIHCLKSSVFCIEIVLLYLSWSWNIHGEHKICDTFCLTIKLLFKEYVSLDLFVLLKKLIKFYRNTVNVLYGLCLLLWLRLNDYQSFSKLFQSFLVLYSLSHALFFFWAAWNCWQEFERPYS